MSVGVNVAVMIEEPPEAIVSVEPLIVATEVVAEVYEYAPAMFGAAVGAVIVIGETPKFWFGILNPDKTGVAFETEKLWLTWLAAA